jgi:hypothetical protein
LCSFLHSPVNIFPFRPKHSIQHPIFKHPQSKFLTKFHTHTKPEPKLYFCISWYFWT